jgi:hypothetical protein
MKTSQIALCIVTAFSITKGVTFAQTSDSTLQALLAEVRQLRLALERSAVVAPKIQVMLQRIQLQQDQVLRLSRQLDDFRDQQARSATEVVNITARLKEVEAHFLQEQDPERRKALENEIKMTKLQLQAQAEQQRLHEAQLQAREMDLASRLRTEQGKLNELNDRLTVLERTLEPPQAKP